MSEQPGACRACAAPMVEGQRFCKQCGTSLDRSCAACSAPLTATQRFCPRCGLPAGGGTQPSTANSPSTPDTPPAGSPLTPRPTVLPTPPPPGPPGPPAAPPTVTQPATPAARPVTVASALPSSPPTMAARPPAPPGGAVPAPPPPARGRGGGFLIAGAVALVLVILVAGGVVLLTRDSTSAPDDAAQPKPTTGTTDAAGAAAPTATPSTTAGDPSAASPSADLDPLDIGVEMTNQGCTGKLLVMYGTAGERDANPAVRKLPTLLGEIEGAKYLRARGSCPEAFRQSGPNGDIFQVYLGPFDSLQSACDTRLLGRTASWVKHLGNPAVRYCICLETAGRLPVLRRGPVSASDAYRVSDVQQFLYNNGYSKDLAAYDIGGGFTGAVETNLEDYQVANGLSATGALDTATWGSILADGCGA